MALVAISPLLLLIAVLIRMDSPGPVIFRQKRTGLGGREFMLYKFRTMIEDAPSIGPVITAKNDPRVTQIGRVLRWTKLDELPQFVNVLKGDMSMVGPRPEVPKMTALYNEEQKQVLSVKPGIMGSSQVSNRDEEAMLIEGDGVENFYIQKILPAKLDNDLHYIRNKDPFKDLKILLGGTVTVLFTSLKLSYIFESKRRVLFLFFDLAIFDDLLNFPIAVNRGNFFLSMRQHHRPQRQDDQQRAEFVAGHDQSALVSLFHGPVDRILELSIDPPASSSCVNLSSDFLASLVMCAK